MRSSTVLAAVLVAAVIGIRPGQAYEGPWCAHYFGTDYTTSCSMRSFDMCLRETRGIGGTFCSPNPRFQADAPAPHAKDRRRQQAW